MDVVLCLSPYGNGSLEKKGAIIPVKCSFLLWWRNVKILKSKMLKASHDGLSKNVDKKIIH